MRLVILISALALVLPAQAAAGPCGGTFQYDSEGYEFDFRLPEAVFPLLGTFDAGGSNGPNSTPPGPRSTNDSYDYWGGLFVGGDGAANAYASSVPGADVCFDEEQGREQVFPAKAIDGLEVRRKVYVSARGLPGARILNLLRNPSGAPRTTSVQIGDDLINGIHSGDLGSDARTRVRSSSSGDAILAAGDRWAVTSDHDAGLGNNDLALAHVFDGRGGRDRIDFATTITADGKFVDNLTYRWDDVSVPAGGTVAYLSFEIQRGLPGGDGAAEDEAARLAALAYDANPLAAIYAGMSDEEIAAVRNWPRPAPTAAFSAPAGASDRAPVTLSAAASAASPVPGSCSGLAYAWSFGAVEPAPIVRFAAGTHTVTLTVTNSCGESATTTGAVEVADATPPTATLRLSRPGLTVRLRSSEPATATLTATIRRRKRIARVRTALEPGRTRTIRLKPSRRAAKVRGRVSVTARITDAAGNTTTLRRQTRGV